MSLFEIWCEQYDPQPVGQVELHTEEHIPQRSPWVVATKVLLASLLTGGLILVPSLALPLKGWQNAAVSVGMVLIYIGLAYFLVPVPNTDNLGWLGGLWDDPFHYSDDLNRGLVFLRVGLGARAIRIEHLIGCSVATRHCVRPRAAKSIPI